MLKLQIAQNQRFCFPKEDSAPKNPKIYFIPKPKCLGIDSMGEFTSAFKLSNQFLDETGKPVPYIHIANTLAEAFNFTFGDAYKSKSRVFNRKTCNLTNALDY
ncbi:hypothetical protein [Apibacter adventoris]|uniref:Uncharacterized protein n=1 Tax=Apibacter adventoris TaxID=1679466 RepID=A0A2S8AEC3_9FLAO|nr:hypothetical protein [Apibacter adventoris]PQL93442.1 hypothetical protein C4S77_04670 [Apibacter adventoris]